MAEEKGDIIPFTDEHGVEYYKVNKVFMEDFVRRSEELYSEHVELHKAYADALNDLDQFNKIIETIDQDFKLSEFINKVKTEQARTGSVPAFKIISKLTDLVWAFTRHKDKYLEKYKVYQPFLENLIKKYSDEQHPFRRFITANLNQHRQLGPGQTDEKSDEPRQIQ